MFEELTRYTRAIAIVGDILKVRARNVGFGDLALVENWDGEAPLIPLIREVLYKERDLIGDERDRILWYTGCSQLVA